MINLTDDEIVLVVHEERTTIKPSGYLVRSFYHHRQVGGFPIREVTKTTEFGIAYHPSVPIYESHPHAIILYKDSHPIPMQHILSLIAEADELLLVPQAVAWDAAMMKFPLADRMVWVDGAEWCEQDTCPNPRGLSHEEHNMSPCVDHYRFLRRVPQEYKPSYVR